MEDDQRPSDDRSAADPSPPDPPAGSSALDPSAPVVARESGSTGSADGSRSPGVEVDEELRGEAEGGDDEEYGFLTPKGSENSVTSRGTEACRVDVEKEDADGEASGAKLEEDGDVDRENFSVGKPETVSLYGKGDGAREVGLEASLENSRVDDKSKGVLEEDTSAASLDAVEEPALQSAETMRWGSENEDDASYGIEDPLLAVNGKLVHETGAGTGASVRLTEVIEKAEEIIARGSRDEDGSNVILEGSQGSNLSSLFSDEERRNGKSRNVLTDAGNKTSEVNFEDDQKYAYLSAGTVKGTERWKRISEEMEDNLRGGGSSAVRLQNIRAWNGELEKEDGDVNGNGGDASPSSSGYAGDPGTSEGSFEIEEADTVQDLPGDYIARQKKHINEDDGSASWRKRKKHFFILSNSGKPIYSRYGDEHKLAGFTATLQAIISFADNSGDRIKSVRAGKHQIVFVVKGPIYLVCISATEEPFEALRGQLELMYGQVILILTKSIDRCFEKNPKYDMAPLLGGTDAVFSSLAHDFGRNPATFLHAFTCIPLPFIMRQTATAALQAVVDSGNLFALLMCGKKVISVVGAEKASLHPDDILLLANFILSSESFRTSESFSPICLPRYNPMAFLYSYVHFLYMNDSHERDIYLVLLSNSADSFYHLKDCRIRIEEVLLKSNVLSEVHRSTLNSILRVEHVPTDSLRTPTSGQSGAETLNNHNISSETAIGGPAGLWHFLYKSVSLDQYISSEFAFPISSTRQQKLLFRAYKKLHASMHDKEVGPHKTQYRRSEDYVLFCWITQDFELYAAFDPLADKAMAIKSCNRVCQWVRELESEIFLFGDSIFSW